MQIKKKIESLEFLSTLSRVWTASKEFWIKELNLSWSRVQEKFLSLKAEHEFFSEPEFEKQEFFVSLWTEFPFVSVSWVSNQLENIWMNFLTRSKQSKQRRHQIFYVESVAYFLSLRRIFSNSLVKLDFCSSLKRWVNFKFEWGNQFFHNFSRV